MGASYSLTLPAALPGSTSMVTLDSGGQLSTAAIPTGTITFGTPASSTAACTVPAVQYDSAYIYTCVATNTWRRAPTAAF